ncbi:MAG: hypothetical protein ACRC2T_13330 [Thermoguttaceae bacterium]
MLGKLRIIRSKTLKNSGTEPTDSRLDGRSFTPRRQVAGGETLNAKLLTPERVPAHAGLRYKKPPCFTYFEVIFGEGTFLPAYM